LDREEGVSWEDGVILRITVILAAGKMILDLRSVVTGRRHARRVSGTSGNAEGREIPRLGILLHLRRAISALQLVELIEQRPQHPGGEQQLARASTSEQIHQLSALAPHTQLVRLKQRAHLQAQSFAQFAERDEAR
jgi:hypothetical protein